MTDVRQEEPRRKNVKSEVRNRKSDSGTEIGRLSKKKLSHRLGAGELTDCIYKLQVFPTSESGIQPRYTPGIGS